MDPTDALDRFLAGTFAGSTVAALAVVLDYHCPAWLDLGVTWAAGEDEITQPPDPPPPGGGREPGGEDESEAAVAWCEP